jgi:hypothetical protein
MRQWALAMALVLAGGLQVSLGTPLNTTVQLPVERLVANVEKWIKEKPQDAQAYFVLGRIHATAWASGPNLRRKRQ